jgi:hypothetical protein
VRRAATAALLLGAGALIAIPVCLVLPVYVLFWVLLPALSIIAGREARRRWQDTDRRIWRWLAISGETLAWFALLMVGGLFLAVPTLTRARLGNNTALTQQDLRDVQAAEEQYRKATGAFASLECLRAAALCTGGSPAAARLPALRLELLARQRAGFDRYFMPGPDAGPWPGAGLRSYALVAVPVVRLGDGSASRPETGYGPLCADSTGRLCRITGDLGFLRDSRCPGSAPPPQAARGDGPLPPCEPTAN